MYKPTKRKGFNFFRSYFDVYNELENDADKVAFMDALLDRQFLGIRPTQLKGMAKFAYISQTNSIDMQVKGYEDKTGIILNPAEPPTQGLITPPSEQVEVKGKVKLQVKEKENNIDERKLKFATTLNPFLDIYGKDFLNDFYKYWTEPNKSNTKFKQELERTWSLERRLETWAKNDKNFNKNGKSKITEHPQFKQITEAVRSDGIRR